MPVSEDTIAAVVSEASARMHDPRYISAQVDLFMGAQPMISQYVMSFSADLEVEGVVTLMFNAALIHRSISAAAGREIHIVSIAELDEAAKEVETPEQLADDEPDLASFIVSNIEMEQGKSLTALAHQILSRITRAMIDKVQ